MKQIVLVRHAKSSWEFDVSDIDRPLKKRGVVDAKLVSDKFGLQDLRPDAIFSSPANRALSTSKIFLKNLKISTKKLEISDMLYDFGGNGVVNFIKELNDKYKCVMIFGHNHAFTAIVNTYGDKYIDNVPTSGLVVLEIDIKRWQDLKPGRTINILFPRLLRRQ